MGETSTKSLLQRIGDKLTDRVLDIVLSATAGTALLGWLVVARHWLWNEWVCVNRPWCVVSGWSLGLLIAGAVILLAVTIYLGLTLRASRRRWRAAQTAATNATTRAPALFFQPIEVIDEKLHLRWFIRRPPREWLHWRNIALTVSPGAVNEVLDGPFHAAPGCNAPLAEATLTRESSPVFEEQCRSCGLIIFTGVRLFEGRKVSVWAVRAHALEELQRMHRNGTVLDGRDALDPPIVLQRPVYWSLMLPRP